MSNPTPEAQELRASIQAILHQRHALTWSEEELDEIMALIAADKERALQSQFEQAEAAHQKVLERVEAVHRAEIEKAAREARIEELKNLPWKRSDRYGINSPYVTKQWLSDRIAELQSHQEKETTQ